MNKVRTFLVTGLHGCGKTTQIEALRKYFSNLGERVYISKALETNSKYGTLFDEIPNEDEMAITFFFLALYVKQRNGVLSALKNGKIVLLDRWGDIYNAYHSKYGFLSKDPDLRNKLKDLAFGKINPDITFYLRITPEEAMKRCSQKHGKDGFDANRLNYDFQNNLFEYYEKQSHSYPWVTIDGTKSVEHVHDEIIHFIKTSTK